MTMSVTKISQAKACKGQNHSDVGEVAVCDTCGEKVFVFKNRAVSTPFCFDGTHKCLLVSASSQASHKVMLLESGEVVKGFDVEVVKGKKVAVGTVGKVFWVGESKYGKSAGLVLESGEKVFVAVGNLRPTQASIESAKAFDAELRQAFLEAKDGVEAFYEK